MSTRATSAFASLRAKQKLVQALFSPKYSKKGPDAHKQLDAAAYTYTQLRSTYLKRLQEIHPDKLAHSSVTNNYTRKTSISSVDENKEQWKNNNHHSFQCRSKSQHEAFVQLQAAWDEYEKYAKMMERARKNGRNHKGEDDVDDIDDPNFTMFGVGCSFADTPDERQRRNEIMDQACRGWFSAGEISKMSCDAKNVGKEHTAVAEDKNDGNCNSYVSLCDDEMFEIKDAKVASNCSRKKASKPKKYLIRTTKKFTK